MSIDYSKLPEGLRPGMKLWIENGVLPGTFLEHVIHNRLVDSFAHADDFNVTRMFDIACFMYNYAPSDCWKTEENIENWIKTHRI